MAADLFTYGTPDLYLLYRSPMSLFTSTGVVVDFSDSSALKFCPPRHCNNEQTCSLQLSDSVPYGHPSSGCSQKGNLRKNVKINPVHSLNKAGQTDKQTDKWT